MTNNNPVDRPSSDSGDVKVFIEDIEKELGKGWGFMPMLGSGISVPSGIPTADKFSAYFSICLNNAIADNLDPHCWDWPSFAVVKQPPGKQPMWKKLNEKLKKAILSLDQNKSDPDAGEGKKILKGLQKKKESLKDWRLGMECLSRLFNSDQMIGYRDERVIDSFFTHLISKRKPSLGHIMLAHLADALRIRTILTTNFDTLTEDAFHRQKKPLATFDVHRNAGLPDPKLVLKHRSIVKLHGGRFGLRADESLLKPPEDSEVETFLEYFGSFPKLSPDEISPARKHLLVIGATCYEKRTMGFLVSALQRFPNVHMFWVCFRSDEVQSVQDAFKGVQGLNNRLHVVVYPDIGILLFQLFQHLYHSLPPAGADYPAFCRVPPDPYPFTQKSRPRADKKSPKHLAKHVETCIADKLDKSCKDASRMIVVDGKKGVSSICSVVWDRLTRQYNCIWLEMDDFLGPEELFVALLAEIARNTGVFPPGPFYPEITPEKCRSQLSQLVTNSHRKFVVFLNGRDGPGRSAGWESPEVPGVAEEQQPSSRWSANQIAKFWSFLCNTEKDMDVSGIVQPAGTDACKEEWLRDIVLVVMVRTTKEKDVLCVPSNVQKTLKKDDYIDVPACIPFDAAKILSKVCDWIMIPDVSGKKSWQVSREDEIAVRERFLYGLTLFRHSRHWAALCSWGLIKAPKRLSHGVDNDEMRAQKGMCWISDLQQKGAVRNKPGGFSWMHRDLRDSLRRKLEEREPQLKGFRAECHQGIADWYVKLFRSSNDPLAALESLYHRLCCIEFADRSTTDEECGDPEHIKETAFIEAITTLKIARERIVSCGYFTASSNLVRQIGQAIARVKLPRAAELTRMCTETLRDFAREAADFRMAFHINDQLHDTIDSSPQGSERDGDHCLARRDYLSLEAKYYKAVILTGLRSYGRAEDEFHDLFRQLGFPDVAADVDLWRGYRVHDMRKMGRTWARSRKSDMNLLQLAIRAIRRYMFLEMLIAQAHEYLAHLACDGRKTDSNAIQEPDQQTDECVSRRTYSEALYVLSTEIMRYIDDHDFLQAENAYLRMLYGVLMATLDRPCEAHRRLNEASGYLAHSQKRNDSIALAVTDLRRAETYLLNGEKTANTALKEKNRGRAKQSKKEIESALAYLEDAVSCLDRAQAYLVEDQRKDVWWWTLMYELRMRTCLCLAKMKPEGCNHLDPSLTARFCYEPHCEKRYRCTQSLQTATQLIVADPFRLARLMKIFKDLVIQLPPDLQKPHLEELKQAAKNLKRITKVRKDEGYGRYPLHDLILEYLKDVKVKTKSKKDQ